VAASFVPSTHLSLPLSLLSSNLSPLISLVLFYSYSCFYFYFLLTVTNTLQVERTRIADSEENLLKNMRKMELADDMSRCKEEWRVKEKEFEYMKEKNNNELKNFNKEIILLNNTLILQHNKHKQEMEQSLNEQQSFYDKSISTQEIKLKKQFINQNIQLKNLTYEIEKERNLYETKISYLNITVEKSKTEIMRLVEYVNEMERNEEYSRINSKNVLEASRTFHRREIEQLEFDHRNNHFDQFNQLNNDKKEVRNYNINLHELKLRDEKKNEKENDVDRVVEKNRELKERYEEEVNEGAKDSKIENEIVEVEVEEEIKEMEKRENERKGEKEEEMKEMEARMEESYTQRIEEMKNTTAQQLEVVTSEWTQRVEILQAQVRLYDFCDYCVMIIIIIIVDIFLLILFLFLTSTILLISFFLY
jgi:hypothetical protein